VKINLENGQTGGKFIAAVLFFLYWLHSFPLACLMFSARGLVILGMPPHFTWHWNCCSKKNYCDTQRVGYQTGTVAPPNALGNCCQVLMWRIRTEMGLLLFWKEFGQSRSISLFNFPYPAPKIQ
jgi:hypothetical protein